MTYVHVAVPTGADGAFTYRVPDGLEARPGCRVMVPFISRRLVGIVVEQLEAPDIDPDLVKDIYSVVDGEPALSDALMRLARFVSEYYLCPIGIVLRTIAPGGPRTVVRIRLTEAGRDALSRGDVRGERRQAILRALADAADGLAMRSLGRSAGKGAAMAVASLARDGLVESGTTHAQAAREKSVSAWRLRADAPLLVAPAIAGQAAARVLALLAEQSEPATLAELALALGKSDSTVRPMLARLERDGRVERVQRVLMRSPAAPRRPTTVRLREHVLNAHQEEALAAVTAAVEASAFHVVLLEGVTGSGKTEVYLRSLERVIARGATGIYLVPEISITPLLLRNVRERFGERTAVLHSGLSDGERHDERGRIASGRVDVVVGARSAVFAPLPNLGLIVVDEEHDTSYKQDSSPRYHGRDVAITRAMIEGVPVVLGSATPSLESSRNAETGRYALMTLPERVGGSRVARVELVDMRSEWRATRSTSPLSRALREALASELAAGRQAMILINRRGWADFMLCRECGEPERCEHCAVTLTVHLASRALICHYCDFQRSIPEACRACGRTFLQNVGQGTEQLEAELSRMLPGVGIARLDADVSRLRGATARVLADFEAGRTRVLVGTQMIAKGHDFPGVTLVGVLQADRALWLPDFRASERTFQLLTQVAGRAGRREHEGRVIIQTFSPDHPAIALAATQDYRRFYDSEAPLREALGYPPFTRLVALLASAPDRDVAQGVASDLAAALREDAPSSLRVLGPAPAPLMRLKDRWRFQVLVKGPDKAATHAPVRTALARVPVREPVRIEVDVDPQSLL